MAQVEAIARVCADEMVSAFGLGGSRDGALRRLLQRAARLPARRLARQVAEYDRIVGESGLPAGGLWALERMARRSEFRGVERVPQEGPLLLVSNHPGLADAVALFAAVPRGDLRVVAARRAFLDELPNTSRCLITLPEGAGGRLGVVREAARHLRGGGAVLTFPGGKIEPDPALLLPGAVESLRDWSASIDLFARLAPNLIFVPAVVSGVVSPASLRVPLTRLRRERRDREWLAATLQMLVPALRRGADVRVEFGRPVTVGEASGAVGEAMLAEARRIMLEHAAKAGRGDGLKDPAKRGERR